MSLWTGFTAARAAPYSRIQPPYSRIQPKEDDAVHKSRLGSLIIDCKTDDLTAAAAFWSAALGYDPATQQTDDRYFSLVGPSGAVGISLQTVEHEARVQPALAAHALYDAGDRRSAETRGR